MLNLIKLKLNKNKKIFDKISTNTNLNKINNIKNFSPATKD
jgi:hypothetical protein